MCGTALAAVAEAPAVSGDSSDTDSSDATAKLRTVSTDDSCENDSSAAASRIRTASGRSSTDTE